MSDLAEFLLARIEEDESSTPHSEHCGIRHWDCDCWVPQRWERDCEAKRRIVEEARDWMATGNDTLRLCAMRVLRPLALPYADHVDYREEWRP